MAIDPTQAMGMYAPQDNLLSQFQLMGTNPELFAELMARQGVPPPDPAALTMLASARPMPGLIPGQQVAPQGPVIQPSALAAGPATDPMANPNAPHNLIRRALGFGAGGEMPTPMGTDAGYPQEPRGMLPSVGAGPLGSPTPGQGAPSPTTRNGAPPKEVMGTEGTKLAEGTVPVPRPRPAEAGPGAAEAGEQTPDLLKLLSGVKAPASPTVQKVSTPSAPAAKEVQQTLAVQNLIKQMIGLAPAAANMLRLGQALGGR